MQNVQVLSKNVVTKKYNTIYQGTDYCTLLLTVKMTGLHKE